MLLRRYHKEVKEDGGKEATKTYTERQTIKKEPKKKKKK